MAAKQYLTTCSQCHKSTSKSYARKNAGRCKSCVTGKPRTETNDERHGRYLDSGHEAYAREEGWYDTPC